MEQNDFYEGQHVKHDLYGNGDIEEIYENIKGETVYEIYFPRLAKTVTVMDENAIKPMGSSGIDYLCEIKKSVENFTKPTKNTIDKNTPAEVKTCKGKACDDARSCDMVKTHLFFEGEPCPVDLTGNDKNEYMKRKEEKDMNIASAYTKADKTFDSVARHREIVNGLTELYAKKNADYGDSFHESYLKWGMVMPLIRVTDKLNRMESLIKSGELRVNDESLRDTVLDAANYLIMTAIEMDREEIGA